jgi:hypothetical protein
LTPAKPIGRGDVIEREEIPCKGHFIGADSCRWHRHTQVGLFRVSSVGDYWSPMSGQRERLGAWEQSFYETMVFPTNGELEDGAEKAGCRCRHVIGWSEIEGKRYATQEEAEAGHEAMVAKYANHPTPEKP